jgi:TolB-like protein
MMEGRLAGERVERRLTAILAADVAGYSRLVEADAEGIAEDIITMLSHSQSFFVIARNSSFTYTDRSVDVKQIARELGVRYGNARIGF